MKTAGSIWSYLLQFLRPSQAWPVLTRLSFIFAGLFCHFLYFNHLHYIQYLGEPKKLFLHHFLWHDHLPLSSTFLSTQGGNRHLLLFLFGDVSMDVLFSTVFLLRDRPHLISVLYVFANYYDCLAYRSDCEAEKA